MAMNAEIKLEEMRAPRLQSVKAVSPKKIDVAITSKATSQSTKNKRPIPTKNAAAVKKSFTGVFG